MDSGRQRPGTEEILTKCPGFLFGGQAEPSCLDAADTNDNGEVVLTDTIFLLNHLFLEGDAPPAPLEMCGSDGTADALGCVSHAPCG